MKRVDEYCTKYGMALRRNSLPKPDTRARHNLLRHVLFDDKRELILCFLPKVNSTTYLSDNVIHLLLGDIRLAAPTRAVSCLC